MTIRRQTREHLARRGGIVFCALIYTVMFLPIAIVVANSFNATTEKPYLTWEGFSLDWYVELFQNASLLDAFGNTALLALVTTVVATILGSLCAYGMYKYRFRGKNVIDSLLYIPVVIPEIVLGISLLMLCVNVNIPRGMIALVIAHVTFCVPFVIFNVQARLEGYDQSVEEASMDLGASRIATFFQVTLPMLAPGIGGGALLAFTLSIDDVIVSYFVYGQDMTFPLLVMQSIKGGVAPDVNALSTLILLGTIVLVVLTQSKLAGKLVRRLKGAR
jgi:spermidine/putrescine transport system permease protein